MIFFSMSRHPSPPPWEGTPGALDVHGKVSVVQWAALWIHPEPLRAQHPRQ